MRCRHHYIHFRRGRQVFSVRRVTTAGRLQFVGSLNGIDCGAWPTREAAVQALLRRAASNVPY